MRDFVDNARLALMLMPTRTLAWIIVIVSALVYLAGCSAPVWPAACPLEAGVRACKGRVWREVLSPHPTKPRPSCSVGYELDGERLPVTVDAEDCGR